MSYDGDPAIIALFTARAIETAALLRQTSQAALGQSAYANAIASPQASQSSAQTGRSITLVLSQKQSIIKSLTFDINLISADGFAQQVSYGASSRQTTHHTPAGYFVDEFGMAPGDFSIDAEVIFRNNNAPSAIQSFFDIFQQSKATSPLAAPVPPYLLKLTDSYLNRSYAVTMQRLVITQAAGLPNTARASLSGQILADYSATGGVPIQQPTATTAPAFGYQADLLGTLA